MILIDAREKSKIQKTIIGLLDINSIDYDIIQLSSGDYVCPESGFAVERKTITDFISSIHTLSQYLFEMREVYKFPMLLIEGEFVFSMRSQTVLVRYGKDIISSGLTIKSLTSFLASIQCKGILLLYTSAPWHTGTALVHLHNYFNKDTHSLFRPKILMPKDEKIAMLCAIPGISKSSAKKLLEEFKSVKNIVNTGISELVQIQGIGMKKARAIHEFFAEEL